MKQTYNYLGALLLLVFSITANAQPTLGWGWCKTIGGTGSEKPAAIVTDSRNGVYVFGNFSSSINADGQVLNSAGGSDLYLIKYDTIGNLQWAKRFGGTANEEAKGLKTDRSGNLVLTGNFEGSVSFGSTTLTSTGASDVCIVKLQPDGNVVWAKQFTGSLADKGGALLCDDQKNIYITGNYLSNDFNIGGSSFTAPKNYNVFYCKLDSNGNKIWAKVSNANTPFGLYNFDVLPGKTLLMYGSLGGNGVDRVNFDPFGIPGATGMLSINQTVFTVKMDTAGNFIAQSNSLGGRANGGGTTLTMDKYVVKAGSSLALSNPVPSALFYYADTNNVLLRQKTYGGNFFSPAQAAANDIVLGKNGKLYSVGFATGNLNFDGISLSVGQSTSVFLVLEMDDTLNVKNLLNTPGQTNQYQSLSKIAADTTTNVMFTTGYFSTTTGSNITVGNNVLPYYGSDDIFVGQIKYIPPVFRAYAGNDTTICSGLGTTIGRPAGPIGGTPPYSYSWSPTTDLANPTAASTLASPTATTAYTLTVTDAFNNVAKDTILINVAPSPTATPTITALDSIPCQGDSATLTTPPTGTYSYNWYNNTAYLTNTAAPTYKTAAAGSYTVRFKDNGTGCLGLASQPVVVQVRPLPPAPIITSNGPNSFCQGDSAGLTSNTQTNYLWSNGATTQSIAVTSSGSYTVRTTGVNGCKSLPSNSVIITANPRPSLGADTLIYHNCYGDITNLPLLYNTTGFTAVWNTATPTMAPPGNYRLIASSNLGCTDTALVNIKLEVAHWTGNVNSDWHTPGNWNINKVPTALTHVIVSFVSTADAPVISTANAVAASLQLRNGASLSTINGMTITIAGNCAVLPPN
jgi:hypothetical protein